MGGETSRPVAVSAGHLSTNPHEHPHWSQVASIPLNIWKSICNPGFNIDYYSEWRNRQLKVYKHPWSNFAIRGKNTNNGKEEKLCVFTCQVSETGRVEKISGWIKDSSVIAFNDKAAVIQIIQSKSVKLLIVDWQSNRLLATYTFGYSKEPCIQECFLSPDATFMLCRQNLPLRRKLGHVIGFDPNIRLIEIKDGLCRRRYVIEDTAAFLVFGSGISMDPCYPSGRAVFFSSSLQVRRNGHNDHQQDGSIGQNKIQVFDLQKRQIIKEEDNLIDHVIHHISHSPDGCLIVALLVNVSMYLTCTVRAHELQIYDSESLAKLHSISLFDHVTKSELLDSFPVFSRESCFLAQVTGTTVCITKLPIKASNLQESCRIVIRRHTTMSEVEKLPLPKVMVLFLKYAKSDFE